LPSVQSSSIIHTCSRDFSEMYIFFAVIKTAKIFSSSQHSWEQCPTSVEWTQSHKVGHVLPLHPPHTVPIPLKFPQLQTSQNSSNYYFSHAGPSLRTTHLYPLYMMDTYVPIL
jgi:hypothetical protein